MNGRRIERAQVALGDVGTRPWRSREAERVVHGKTADAAAFRAAAEAALRGAHPRPGNAYKVELAKRCIVRTHTNTTVAA